MLSVSAPGRQVFFLTRLRGANTTTTALGHHLLASPVEGAHFLTQDANVAILQPRYVRESIKITQFLLVLGASLWVESIW